MEVSAEMFTFFEAEVANKKTASCTFDDALESLKQMPDEDLAKLVYPDTNHPLTLNQFTKQFERERFDKEFDRIHIMFGGVYCIKDCFNQIAVRKG